MIESLHRHEPHAKVVVYAFDDVTAKILRELAWSHVQVVTLAEFETEELLRVKPTRSKGEYCWTSTSVTIAHTLQKLGFDSCTYLDADLYFFSSPSVLFDESPSASVLLTEHRYTPRYDQTATSGRFCVQFMHFKKDEQGLTALLWWKDRCIEWCYDRAEDGKFGDQKYLDDWLTRFAGVADIKNEGAGVAPWNIQQYLVFEGEQGPWLKIASGQKTPVVFYHFHGLKLLAEQKIDLCNYVISAEARKYIYRPYIETLLRWQNELKKTFSLEVPASPCPSFLRKIRRARSGFPNILAIEKVLNA
jgi:hypothetical protein